MRITEVMQDTPAWHIFRNRGLGSSDAAVLWNGTHFGTTPYDLWIDKTGKGVPKEENWAMRRGKALEPVARQMYEDLTGYRATPICALHESIDWLKASLDGWDADEGIIQEIKCPNKYDHADALANRIPVKYQPQILHQFMVGSGKCTELHYISYNEKSFSASEKYALVTVKVEQVNPTILKKFLEKEQQFWSYVTRRFPPREEFLPLCEEVDVTNAIHFASQS